MLSACPLNHNAVPTRRCSQAINPLGHNIPATVEQFKAVVESQRWPLQLSRALAIELLLRDGEQVTVRKRKGEAVLDTSRRHCVAAFLALVLHLN